MKVVIQRVSNASVSINNEIISSTKKGFLILLGIADNDTQEDINYLCNKILQLRVFNDLEGKMNNSIQDIEGEILIVSQFTLQASTKKGTRPSFIKAARPDVAIPLYEKFISQMKESNLTVQTGKFGANMQVNLTNDGPVTIIIDSKNKL